MSGDVAPVAGETVEDPFVAVLTRAIHEAECEAYTHEGRNARCERSARAGITALADAGLLALAVEAAGRDEEESR